jgi:hypothetical protein
VLVHAVAAAVAVALARAVVLAGALAWVKQNMCMTLKFLTNLNDE